MPTGDIYARAFQYAQIGLLLLETETGRVLEANTAFLEIAGLACAGVVGRSFWEPPLVADADAGAEIDAHLKAGGAVTDAELPLRTGDGRWRLLQVSGNEVNGLVHLAVRDATGHEQARLAERFQVLRALAVRAAAEFHNLHRTLTSTGELLLIGAGQGRPVLRELDEIQQASERAHSIACQLDAFGGAMDIQIQPVVLNNLVESMLPRLRQLFGRKIEIVADLSPDAIPVMADPQQMRQVILKLAANSSDAMGTTGTFCLQTRNASAVEPGLGAAEMAAGACGMLALSDNGPGLDDQSWAHLYEPFFTTKANGRSLGLSLAAVYGIVRHTGGRLWAYSQAGKGATFRIYLPLAGTQFPALPAPLPDCSKSNASILLVEPNDGMRSVMSNLLKRQGYRVLAAVDFQEALQIAAAHGPPDLLISQPEPELARRLTTLQPRLRVLYVGGYTDGLFAQDYGLPPRTSFLQKPFEPETLLARVVELLHKPL